MNAVTNVVMLPASAAADLINEEHRLARADAGTAVEHAIRCGQLLIEQKRKLDHGNFGSWIVANCEFSERTARLYITASKQNGNALPISSLRQLYRPGNAPEPTRSANLRLSRSDRLALRITAVLNKHYDALQAAEKKLAKARAEVRRLRTEAYAAIRTFRAKQDAG